MKVILQTWRTNNIAHMSICMIFARRYRYECVAIFLFQMRKKKWSPTFNTSRVCPFFSEEVQLSSAVIAVVSVTTKRWTKTSADTVRNNSEGRERPESSKGRMNSKKNSLKWTHIFCLTFALALTMKQHEGFGKSRANQDRCKLS